MELVARGTLAGARSRLDQARLRKSRAWRSAAQCDRELLPAAALADRETFYAAAQQARARAMLDAHDDHERRRAERKATLTTLVCFGLITMNRGGAPVPDLKPEVVL